MSIDARDGSDARRVLYCGSLAAEDGGVGVGVATLNADGGPLLSNAGVDARMGESRPSGGADAVKKRGTDEARTVGVLPGIGRWNQARQEAGVVRLKCGFCDVIQCVEAVAGTEILHQLY